MGVSDTLYKGTIYCVSQMGLLFFADQNAPHKGFYINN